MEPTLLALAGIVFVSYTVQTVSGFGAVVVALTLSAHLMSIPEILPLIIPLSIAQCAYIALRYRGTVDGRMLARRILPLMGAGTVAGMMIAPHLGGSWLRLLFAVMVLVLSARELWILVGTPRAQTRQIGSVPLVGSLVGAGVIHGVYATGGPLLVYATSRAGLSKAAFRSTLTVVWLVLNTALTAGFIRAGAYDASSLEAIALLAPAVPLGIVLGEVLHHRVDERLFRIVTFALLCGAAITLLIR